MNSPFDVVSAINSGKRLPFEEVEDQYNSYLIDNQYSYFIDTILLANEMNRSSLTNRMKYDFYKNTVRPMKRFSKWAKKNNTEDILLIQKYYKCSIQKAKEYSYILTKEQKEIIKSKFYEGGTK